MLSCQYVAGQVWTGRNLLALKFFQCLKSDFLPLQVGIYCLCLVAPGGLPKVGSCVWQLGEILLEDDSTK